MGRRDDRFHESCRYPAGRGQSSSAASGPSTTARSTRRSQRGPRDAHAPSGGSFRVIEHVETCSRQLLLNSNLVGLFHQCDRPKIEALPGGKHGRKSGVDQALAQ